MQQAHIFVGPSERHGKGVFSANRIEAGEIIEICPIILFPVRELLHVRATVLDDYYFDWGDDAQWYAFALGYGSIYNHSYEPNAEYEMDFVHETIDFYCVRDIEAGDEITVNYNGDPDNNTKVWFEK